MTTVRDLIALLEAIDPDLPVVVDCEMRGSPHPFTSVVTIGRQAYFFFNSNIDLDDEDDQEEDFE